MSDYADRPFVAGSLIGLRYCDIRVNALFSPIYRYQWVPGENVAVCYSHFDSNDHISTPHRPGALGCLCGFYAFTNNYPNDYPHPSLHYYSGKAAVIIEGYGLCTVGERGFRSEFARIRAAVSLSPMLNDVCDAYGVNDYLNLEDALRDFPLTSVATPIDTPSIP